MSDENSALVGGLFCGFVIACVLFTWVNERDGFEHRVGAKQRVCMTIEDRALEDDGTSIRRTKCADGMRVIEWLREDSK